MIMKTIWIKIGHINESLAFGNGYAAHESGDIELHKDMGYVIYQARIWL